LFARSDGGYLLAHAAQSKRINQRAIVGESVKKKIGIADAVPARIKAGVALGRNDLGGIFYVVARLQHEDAFWFRTP